MDDVLVSAYGRTRAISCLTFSQEKVRSSDHWKVIIIIILIIIMSFKKIFGLNVAKFHKGWLFLY